MVICYRANKINIIKMWSDPFLRLAFSQYFWPLTMQSNSPKIDFSKSAKYSYGKAALRTYVYASGISILAIFSVTPHYLLSLKMFLKRYISSSVSRLVLIQIIITELETGSCLYSESGSLTFQWIWLATQHRFIN